MHTKRDSTFSGNQEVLRLWKTRRNVINIFMEATKTKSEL